ncbi:hypothetical protein N9Q06_01120 [bacterium]|nr:hypothetical protein [bacterium]
MPYREAESYKASIYYWWWAFLKRNPDYQRTCANSGNGMFAGLYKDFGNIFELDFLTWWSCHQGLFAEKTSLIEQAGAHRLNPTLLYQIDLNRPLSHIQEEIKALHMHAHAIMPAAPPKQTSTAKYPIYTNVSAHTLHKVLTIWDLRCAHPDTSAYDLGVLAGFRANILAPPEYGETRTRAAIKTDAHNKQARTGIANQTNRYLRTAEQYIDNVGRGEFPKALRR